MPAGDEPRPCFANPTARGEEPRRADPTKAQCELDPNSGSVCPDDAINPTTDERPNADDLIETPEDQNTRHGDEARHICLLVVGPSGSGKSSFIASVSETSREETNAVIGHGMDPCTVTCSSHEFIDPTSGTRITLLDTPGFNDQARNNLDILAEIAAFLSSNTLPPISAVVFTHAITENRVAGSSRLNLEIAKALCGTAFYPRLALLTTMWNKIPNEDMRDACIRREDQILTSPALWGEMNKRGCCHGRFNGTSTSGWDFLKPLLALDESSAVSLGFEQELLSGAKLEQTKAGAIILAEQEMRRQQAEAELLEIRNEEMERLQAERLQLQELLQRGDELGMGQLAVDQAPSGQAPMTYLGRPDRMSASPGGSMLLRHGLQPQPYPDRNVESVQRWLRSIKARIRETLRSRALESGWQGILADGLLSLAGGHQVQLEAE